MRQTRASDVTLGASGLETTLEDGTTAYFNYYWLRDNCPTSFDRQTRERTYDIFAETHPPVPQSARIVGDELEIVWSGQTHVTRHGLGWLRGYARAEPRHDTANLPRRCWYADHYPKIARFAQPALSADHALVAKWIEALLVEGVAIVTDMPSTDQALSDTARRIGNIRATFFGDSFEVKTHINPTNLAFTAAALELHTDVPAEDQASGVQLLHCRANSVTGGHSLFVDGVAVATDLRDERPEDFALLCATEIPFSCEHDAFDMRARHRVIELDAQGEISGVTLSQHLADVIDLPQEFLDRYYPALCHFGQRMRSDTYLMRFRLEAGECIVFDNHRVVHGREAYSATSGERHLRGCYVDRGEMRSTYRTLEQHPT